MDTSFFKPTITLLSIALLLSASNCSSPWLPGLPQDSPFSEGAPILPGALSHGIAAGDVTSHAALVWLRTEGQAEVEVRWAPVGDWDQVESDASDRLSRVNRRRLNTTLEQDFTLKVPLEGLMAGTRYRYEVRSLQPANLPASPSMTAQGEFMTAPEAGKAATVTLLWSGDLGGQGRCRDEEEGYPIFDVMQNQHPDFALLLGDLIYGDGTCASPPNVSGSDFIASALDQYRAKHRYQRGSSALQRFLAAVPVWATWDDHEVRNNFSGPFDSQMPIGRRALLEYWPIRTPPNDPHRLYRQVRYGDDLELFILDTRQYRSRNAELDGPNKTMLGETQRAWLLEELARSTATWKLVATSVPLSNVKGESLLVPGNDSWARGKDGTGFQTELNLIVEAILSRQILNVVWLAGDVHYVQANAYDPNGDGMVDFHEFICGPLSAASPIPVMPGPVFRPTTLFSDHGFLNFGKVTVQGNRLTVVIIDDNGKVRYSHQLTAR